MNIRPTTSMDLPGLQRVLDDTGLFPSDMLSEMIGDFLTARSDAIWLTCERDGAAIGFCYAEPEPMTDRTWNMRAIGVCSDRQGDGVGAALVAALEDRLSRQGQRLLIVDTSGAEAYARSRNFYRKNGYAEEARIRDFWSSGDDKVTFRKTL